MKKRFLLHKGYYAIEENQNFYRTMADHGWMLEKRGVLFSHFRSGEPRNRTYRLILPKPGSWKEPEAEVPNHEGEGWRLVSETGGVLVYETDKTIERGSVGGPIQEEAALKAARKKYLWNIFGLFLTLLLEPYLLSAILPFTSSTVGRISLDIQRFFIQFTAFFLIVATLVIFSLLHAAYGALRLSREIARLREQDENVFDDEKRGHPSYARMAFVVIMVFFSGLSLVQLSTGVEYEMPSYKENDYLLLEELGHAPRKPFDPSNVETDEFGFVEKQKALLSEWVQTTEYSDQAFLMQTRFNVHQMVDPLYFGKVLMQTAVFEGSMDGWTSYTIENVDAAYAGEKGLEFLMVKDHAVLFLRYSGSGTILKDEEQTRKWLEKVAGLVF